MKLFGKKTEIGGVTNKPRKAKKNKRVFKNPPDAKLFYRMPKILMVGVLCIVAGLVIMFSNDRSYTQKVLSSSMPKGTVLPTRSKTQGGGNLRLGNTLLSADGKTLAVEVQYDEDAHNALSSFGDNYRLYLIDTKKNVMKNVTMSYGMFGTDGSGVLEIKNSDGFADRAFMVMVIDKGVIVSSDSLTANRTMTDSEIDKSLAKQLEDIEASNNEKATTTSEVATLPPSYMIRLNGFNAKKSYRNWQDDSDLVEDLFVNNNLKKIKKNQEEIEDKIKAGKKSLDEMNKRLGKNQNDTIAQSNKQTLESTLQTLEDSLDIATKNYSKISKSNIDSDVLKPKQKKFKRYEVDDLNLVK